MFFDESILPMEGDSVKIKVEGVAPFQADLSCRIKPEAHELWVAGRIDPAAILGEKGTFGGAVKSGKQGQPLIEDLAHDMAVTGIAEELQSEERPDGMGCWDHFGTRETCLIEDLVQADLDEVRQEKKQAAELGLKVPAGKIQVPHVCNGSNLRPNARRPFVIASPGQAGKALFLEDHGHRRRTQFVSLIAQEPADIIDREVLLAQGNDFVPKPICFGSTLGSFGGRGKEVSMGVLAKLMTKDPEASLCIPKASSHLGRGDAFDEIGSQRLVLPVSGIGGFEEDPGEVC